MGPARRRFLAPLAMALALLSCRRDTRTPIVLYSPHGRDLLGVMERTYESRHPDVDVRWLDMGSQEIYDRIRSEKANPQADVWYGGPDTIFARGAREELLMSFRPGWAAAIPEEGRAPGDFYFALYRTPAVIVYNASAIAGAEAPRDWDDLLDARWKGKILIRYPLASGTMRAFFGMILARSVERTGSPDAGFAWLKRLDAQTRGYEMNASVLVERIARREGLITVWDLPDVLLEMRRSSGLAYVFPSSGTPVIVDAIGLVRGARHAAAAREFIEWLGSAEGERLAAERAFRLPARRDLPEQDLPQWVRDVDTRLVPAKMNWSLIDREGAGWMARWDREVRGKGN
ncbi:MAG TPA: extracellular solute-binding protein [Thermoanaerobaculia bacterium]|nr:extracellular solute-binding protein [Thermoanaerobaculia bacterium]